MTQINSVALPDKEFTRLGDAQNTEEHVISACLHSKQALALAMSRLVGIRDFKSEKNRDAFSIIEMHYEKGEQLDPVVIIDSWIDMGIYDSYEAQTVAGKWSEDSDYEAKIKELSRIGGLRKAQTDIQELNKQTKKHDATPERIAQQAFDKALSWNSGYRKKYYTAREVHEMKNERGEKLNLGIPLLDETVYKYAGLHKGTVKGKAFRSKHGKTRSQCFEVAQHLRQGRTVMYFTLEGQNTDILNNVKQILKDEWRQYQESFLLVDDCFTINEIKSAFIEAEFSKGVDVCVVDYLQEVMLDVDRYVGENERINHVCRELTQIATKHDVLMDLLSQVTTTSKADRGYSNVPSVDDIYGSKQLKKAASIIMIGFRPKHYEELITETSIPPFKKCVKDPDGKEAPISSVFIKPALSRKKLECQHQWVHFVDTDEGLKLYSQDLI